MKFAGWYGISVGFLMVGMWIFFLTVLGVPELETEPWRIGFHLVAELVTAVALVVSGAALLTNKSWGASLYLVSAGMLIYTVINSPGYFAQQGDWAFVVMFAVLIVLALVSVVKLLRHEGSELEYPKAFARRHQA
jgi:phosphotransferase system  glucose/maltose/N-acetylglucosamine-specific IIC component